MGRETKNFRQTNRSQAATQSARNYGKIQRQGSWGLNYGTSKKRRNIA